MNEKIEKAIKIIYTAYDVIQDGNIRWKEKEVIVPFSKITTEYIDKLSYQDNMEAMLLDIFESGFVFINDNIAIPVFNIKQFMAYDSKELIKPIINNESKSIKPNFNKWHNKKKFHGKRPDDRGNQSKKPIIVSEDFPIQDKTVEETIVKKELES